MISHTSFIINFELIKIGQQIVDMDKEFSDILMQYIKHYKLEENKYFFGLKTDPTRRNQNPNSVNSIK